MPYVYFDYINGQIEYAHNGLLHINLKCTCLLICIISFKSC